jgi:signal transduction histidine kinase
VIRSLSLPGLRARGPRVATPRVYTTLKAEVLLGLAVLGTAALALAALDLVALRNLVNSANGALYLALLIIGNVVLFVVLGSVRLERLVVKPLDGVVNAVEAIANGDLTRRVPPGETRELARLSHSVNRMTGRLLAEQAQRAQLEKVASVGRLAAGVANGIDAPLAAIAAHADVLRALVGGDPRAAEAVAAIERERARIGGIVSGMLDYARARERVSLPMNPNEAARSAVRLLSEHGALCGVRVTLELSDELPPLPGDPHEMEQVFVNLLLNAADALEGDGAVTILSERISFAALAGAAPRRAADPEDFAVVRDQSARVRSWLHAVGEPDEVIRIVVADTGPGVPWEQRERVFDPFFTTREPGKGTGLGLALVARIVEGLGGTVWVRTAREGGAAFVICLPLAALDEEVEIIDHPQAMPQS